MLVVEAKLTHCKDANEQLQYLYGPLASYIFLNREIHLLEVCKFVSLPHICIDKLDEAWECPHTMYHFLGL